MASMTLGSVITETIFIADPHAGHAERVDLEDAPQQSRSAGLGGRGAWLGVRAPLERFEYALLRP